MSKIFESINPFAQINYVPESQELIDQAFRKASHVKVNIPKKVPKIIKTKRKEVKKLRVIEQFLDSRLTSIVKQIPSIDYIHPFYSELADILVGRNRFKKALGSIYGTRKVVKRLIRNHIYKIKSAKEISEVINLSRAAYGRLNSTIHRIKDSLNLIREARQKLRKLPSVDPKKLTIVIAGYPNVGKSSFVAHASTANPEIAEYPFTTQKVKIGHIQRGLTTFQIVDTPGLLDRPLSERNPIELQAITALNYLAHVILYMVDPSETCGYPLKEQLSLYGALKEIFGELPFFCVINKMDLVEKSKLDALRDTFEDECFATNALKGNGVNEAIERIINASLLEN
ncbi:MAG: NOG1 family protein [Promethearchaeota archaeon]